jgi:hypothetical protein
LQKLITFALIPASYYALQSAASARWHSPNPGSAKSYAGALQTNPQFEALTSAPLQLKKLIFTANFKLALEGNP